MPVEVLSLPSGRVAARRNRLADGGARVARADTPAGPRRNRLFASVDGASLAAFRVAFGIIMLWEVWRYFSHGSIQ